MKKFLYLFMCFFIMSLGSICYAKVDVPETVRIKLNDGSIEEIDFNEYLYGVVLHEMGTSYTENGVKKEVGIEALKAQAVASRTYAIYTMNSSKHEGQDYDLTSSTSDQVYAGGKIPDIVKEAVDSTDGQVITYDGEVISAFFFATSGGHTESPENVWSGKLPYLVGVEDKYEPYIKGSSEWVVRIPKSKYGKIEILERSENDRVTKLKVGNEVLTKNGIRTKLGTTLIKSTWFDLEYDEKTDEYVFTGKGYGHGVGMSQHGAMGMAEAGFDYEEILTWYYTDVEIEPELHAKKVDKDITEVKDKFDNRDVEIKKDVEEEEEYRPLLAKVLDAIENINMWGGSLFI